MTDDIRPRQIEILNYIKKKIKEQGYPPSVREIGEGVGLKSSSTVHKHLTRLEERGYIRKDPSKPRAIEVITPDRSGAEWEAPQKEMIDIPIVGRVTAGEPVLAMENIEDTFPVPVDFIQARNRELFMLRVRGRSMIEAGIYDGDYAIVEKTDTADSGEIIVALLENEATVKRLKKDDERVLLVPENKDMEPIEAPHSRVLGRVIGIFRSLG